jgi:hypothetical protein
MKDPILEEVWKAKELVSQSSRGDIRSLATYIKKEAAKARKVAQKSFRKRTA